MDLNDAIYQAESKAWKALAKYKFWMFGYWAAIWVHLNHLEGKRRPNPWKKLIGLAQKEVASEKFCNRYPGIFSKEV